MIEAWRGALDGVGVGYNPFLHGILTARSVDYDVVELPLDRYLDEARRALLDPDLTRLGAVAASRPSVLRGSAFSLGSVEMPDTTAVEASLARLVETTGAVVLREELAFRRVGGRDLGVPQLPPLTGPMAALIGGRCEALRSRLPCGLALGLPLDALAGAPDAQQGGVGSPTPPCSSQREEEAEWRGTTHATLPRAFIGHLTRATACGLVLDIGPRAVAAGPDALRALLAEVPEGRVIQIVLTTTEAAVWPLLDALLAATGARSVVIRRDRMLFPLDDILEALARAREALTQVGRPFAGDTREAAVASENVATTAGHDLADLERDQAAFADLCFAGADDKPVPDAVAAVRAQAVWRDRVADIHRARQLARWAARPADWRV